MCHNPTLTKLTNQILPRHHLLHLTHETLTLIFFSPSTTMAVAAAPPHLTGDAPATTAATIFNLHLQRTCPRRNLHHATAPPQHHRVALHSQLTPPPLPAITSRRVDLQPPFSCQRDLCEFVFFPAIAFSAAHPHRQAGNHREFIFSVSARTTTPPSSRAERASDNHT